MITGDLHGNCIIGQSDIMVEDHLFPNNRCLSRLFENTMRCLCETIESLLKRLSASIQLRLRFVILSVAGCVELISPGGEVLGREFRGYGAENRGSKINGFR